MLVSTILHKSVVFPIQILIIQRFSDIELGLPVPKLMHVLTINQIKPQDTHCINCTIRGPHGSFYLYNSVSFCTLLSIKNELPLYDKLCGLSVLRNILETAI